MAFNLRHEIFKLERVLRISTRPREKEFWHMAQVTAIGVLLMGAVGLSIFFVLNSFDHLISGFFGM